MRFRSYIAAGIVITAATVAGAFAHGGATGVVKERMDAMGAMGDTVKVLSEMMRGATAYDADTVRKGAMVIRSHAGEAMTKLFPEGSNEKPSESRDEIWSNWNEFERLAEQLLSLANGLEQAADNGLMMSGSKSSTDMMGGGNKTSSMMGDGNSAMGGSSMMGGGMMMRDGAMPDANALASMPADGVFNMVAQTCSSCHTKFRLEKK